MSANYIYASELKPVGEVKDSFGDVVGLSLRSLSGHQITNTLNLHKFISITAS
ncbi:hypothetical protein ACF8PD_02790 [Vibrio plantisponsor]|uniref:hypothetical protein n=1 Tax=Vibrio plantisponsor TaxID=664643 RepID=UPI00370B6E1A